MANARNGVVIAGGGLAGQRCAETLRRMGYDGAIRIVAAEPVAPYDRPPLSKELLAGNDRRRHPSRSGRRAGTATSRWSCCSAAVPWGSTRRGAGCTSTTEASWPTTTC